MILVSVNKLCVSFGSFDVLDGVTCQVEDGDRIGLIGRNGSGKTTLLRALAGTQEPTSGRRHVARGLNVELVEQVPQPGYATIHEFALSSCVEVVEMERALERVAEELAKSSSDGVAARYEALQLRFEAAGGFSYHVLVEEVLTGLGFPRRLGTVPSKRLVAGSEAASA